MNGEKSHLMLSILYVDGGPVLPGVSRLCVRRTGDCMADTFGPSREVLAITRIPDHETGKYGNGARLGVTVPKGGLSVLRGMSGRHPFTWRFFKGMMDLHHNRTMQQGDV
jgi:hypothetical protein